MGSEIGKRVKRINIFEPAAMRVGRFVQRVHLLDISCTGALVHSRPAPADGTIIVIDLRNGQIPARVAWSKGHRFGLAFLQPIQPFQIEALFRELSIVIRDAERPVAAQDTSGNLAMQLSSKLVLRNRA